jgi:hypothetical protein
MNVGTPVCLLGDQKTSLRVRYSQPVKSHMERARIHIVTFETITDGMAFRRV